MISGNYNNSLTLGSGNNAIQGKYYTYDRAYRSVTLGLRANQGWKIRGVGTLPHWRVVHWQQTIMPVGYGVNDLTLSGSGDVGDVTCDTALGETMRVQDGSIDVIGTPLAYGLYPQAGCVSIGEKHNKIGFGLSTLPGAGGNSSARTIPGALLLNAWMMTGGTLRGGAVPGLEESAVPNGWITGAANTNHSFKPKVDMLVAMLVASYPNLAYALTADKFSTYPRADHWTLEWFFPHLHRFTIGTAAVHLTESDGSSGDEGYWDDLDPLGVTGDNQIAGASWHLLDKNSAIPTCLCTVADVTLANHDDEYYTAHAAYDVQFFENETVELSPKNTAFADTQHRFWRMTTPVWQSTSPADILTLPVMAPLVGWDWQTSALHLGDGVFFTSYVPLNGCLLRSIGDRTILGVENFKPFGARFVESLEENQQKEGTVTTDTQTQDYVRQKVATGYLNMPHIKIEVGDQNSGYAIKGSIPDLVLWSNESIISTVSIITTGNLRNYSTIFEGVIDTSKPLDVKIYGTRVD